MRDTWTPPPASERPDGFECLAKVNEYDGSDVSKGSFYWAHVMWQAPNDDYPEGIWMHWPDWVEVMDAPIAFAPLPSERTDRC